MSLFLSSSIDLFFLRFYLFIFREAKEREREEEKTAMCGCLLRAPYWGPGLQPRHVPNWESNWQPFGSQASAQSTATPARASTDLF